MLRRFIAAALLALLPTAAFALAPRDFPLTPHHSGVAQAAESLEAAPGAFCKPDGNEIFARFDEGGYHWTFLGTVKDDGSSRFMFVQYALEGDRSEPIAVWIGESPAGDNDTIRILQVLDGKGIAERYPQGPCSVLYPETA